MIEFKKYHSEKIITSNTNWWLPDIMGIWAYRELCLMMVKQKFLVRYQQMIFGATWAILAPMVQLVVFTIFFGIILKIPSEGYPYVIFAYAGLMPWDFFNKCAIGVSTSLQENMAVISKVYFPRFIMPIVVLARESIDALIGMTLLIIIAAYLGYWPTPRLFLLPLVLLATMISGLAMGLVFAGPIVRFRDLKVPLQYVLQLAMFLTPVIYPSKILPPKYAYLMELNPMYWVIEASRWIILGQPLIITERFYWSVGGMVFISFAGWLVFAFTERVIVDVQ